MAENELLLYPLGDPDDQPPCAECGAEMLLVKLEAAPKETGTLTYSTFRCPACGHSETFIAEPGDVS